MATEKKAKLTDFPKYESNPFAESVYETLSTKKKYRVLKNNSGTNGQLIVDNDNTDVVLGTSVFTSSEIVDEEKFVKIFLNQIALLWDLGKPAIKVFSYIMTVITPNKDSFIFRKKLCMEFVNYSSEKPIFEGLAELIKVGIIAKTNYDFEFYINPALIFNGNRIVIAKEYKTVKASKKTENENQLSLFDAFRTT